MATLQAVIKDRLAGDANLTAPVGGGGLGFGVYAHWLVPSGPGSTPDAFDPAKGGRLKRSIVVMPGNENAHPSPSIPDWRTYDVFFRLFLFAEAHANGKQAIEEAKLRIERLLIKPWTAITTGGQRLTLVPADDLELDDAENFPGNVVAIIRWRATGARALQPV